MSKFGWIGVDLDGTLAEYDGWKGIDHVGAPVPRMVERVKRWIGDGQTVKIFTARVFERNDATREQIVRTIHEFLDRAGLPRLEVTNVKDFGMIELWDDRAVGVVPNTGIALTRPEAT